MKKSRYLATFVAALLVACVAGAQPAKQGGPVPKKEKGGPAAKREKGARGKREGVYTEGNILVFVQAFLQGFDTNRSMIIEENEMEKGFLEMLERYEECHGLLLKLFDENKDGAFNKKEGYAARKFAFNVMGLLRCDPNRDWQVDDAEADQAWDKLADACQRHNEGNLTKFDKDQDGKVSPAEIEAARTRMRQWQGHQKRNKKNPEATRKARQK